MLVSTSRLDESLDKAGKGCDPEVAVNLSRSQLEHDTFLNWPMEEGAMLPQEQEQFLDRF